MKLKFRELSWAFLFKFKVIRLIIFYNLKRYNQKLKLLNNLNLNKNSIVLDIGSNNGMITQYLYDKYSCSIFSFEPNPYCFLLQKDIFRRMSKIKIFNKAVSNDNKKKKLYLSKYTKNVENMSTSESSSLEKAKSNISHNKFVYVKTISIKKLLSKFKYIDLVKIDIEGHEYKILPEILRNINKIGKIFCEMHGKDHRKEFEKKFNFWEKKIRNLKERKFFYW